MEINELLTSLAKMEASLSEIESAREQVKSTVQASSELQKEVQTYVSSVKELCVSLKTWEDNLKAYGGSLSHDYETAISKVNTTCADIISSFDTSVKKAGTDFKTKTENTIQKFAEQNNKLTERVKDLNTLKDDINKATAEIQSVKDTLTQISKDLKESQDGQDTVLADIKQKLSEATGMITGVNNSISEKYKLLANDLQSGLDSVGKKVDNVYTELSKVESICQDIISVIENSKNETAKSININRWILIAAFIFLVILHFV